MQISTKPLTTLPELKQLVHVFSLAFDEPYTVDDSYLSNLLQNNSAILLGAFIEENIVGGIVAFEMNPIHGTKELYIYDIAVHPKHQKQGIGKKLIDHIKIEAKTRGIGTIFVEAESEDKGAVAFYRSIGGEELLVNHFNFNI